MSALALVAVWFFGSTLDKSFRAIRHDSRSTKGSYFREDPTSVRLIPRTLDLVSFGVLTSKVRSIPHTRTGIGHHNADATLPPSTSSANFSSSSSIVLAALNPLVEAKLQRQPVMVLCLQRSGSNLLRQSADERFVLPTYEFRKGSPAEHYCIPCAVAAGRTTRPECATKDFVREKKVNGVETRAPMVHVRGAPGSAHFHVHATSFAVDGFYTSCGFPSIRSYAIQSLADLDAIYGTPATFLVAVKDPVAWFVSVHRFWKLNCTAVPPTECVVRSVSGRSTVLDLWVNYYRKWLALANGAVATAEKLVRAAKTKAGTSNMMDGTTANQLENITQALTAARSISIVRYEDMLAAPSYVLEQLQWRHAWVDRDVSREDFEITKIQVHVSVDSSFDGKRKEYAKRIFLEQMSLPEGFVGAGQPLGWFRRNCAILSAYFNETDVDEALGYDLGYVHACRV